MIDLGDQLRTYFDTVDPPFEPEDLMREHLGALQPGRVRVSRGYTVAVAAAILVAVFVGLPLLLIALGEGTEPARSPSTSVPSPTGGGRIFDQLGRDGLEPGVRYRRRLRR